MSAVRLKRRRRSTNSYLGCMGRSATEGKLRPIICPPDISSDPCYRQHEL